MTFISATFGASPAFLQDFASFELCAFARNYSLRVLEGRKEEARLVGREL